MKIKVNKDYLGGVLITIPSNDKDFVLATSRVCQKLGEAEARRRQDTKEDFEIILGSFQADIANVVKALAVDHGWEIVEETR